MAHYYNSNGDSCHEIVGANGKLRPTTLRDARKNNWCPSVTTIMDVQAKPNLVQWLQDQILEAAITKPFNVENYYEKDWKREIIAKSKEVGEKAAKRGNEIHDKLDKYFSSNITLQTYLVDEYTKHAINLIHTTFPGYIWKSEESFCHVDGFAGRVDLNGVGIDENGEVEHVIIDFKTKDKTELNDNLQYDDHRIQLAAYQVGLQLPESTTKRYNLFISVNEDTKGLCHLVECKEFDKYQRYFYALKEVWQIKNNYVPVLG